MTTTALGASLNEKYEGIHGLHLLSTVVDTFTQTPKESSDTATLFSSLTFPLHADIAIRNLQHSRLLAASSTIDGKLNQHDLMKISARSFPVDICNSLQDKGLRSGRFKCNLPVRISYPVKGSHCRSAVFASRSNIGSSFTAPVSKTAIPAAAEICAESSPESSCPPQDKITMVPQLHHNRQLVSIASTVATRDRPKSETDVVQGKTNKDVLKRALCDSKVNRKKRKINTKAGTTSTTGSNSTIVTEKVPATALLANGEPVTAKKCTAELNYIKHKAVPMREKWMARFLELAEFKKKYGHTKVPHNFPDSPKLAEWQKFQRQQRKLFVKGKHSQLTPERVVMLEKIGFVWEARIESWESHYQNLKRFKETNGHIYVPVANTVLSQWVKRQRKQYKKYEKGQDSSLTSDRVERLNQLDFIWDGRHLTE